MNIILIFVLSLKHSERFLLSLPPGQNCSNDKSLSPKYEILGPVCLCLLNSNSAQKILKSYQPALRQRLFTEGQMDGPEVQKALVIYYFRLQFRSLYLSHVFGLPKRNFNKMRLFTDAPQDPIDIYLFKVNYRNTRTRYEICSKLTIRTKERRQRHRAGVFIVNFEHISHLPLVFLLLTLSR